MPGRRGWVAQGTGQRQESPLPCGHGRKTWVTPFVARLSLARLTAELRREAERIPPRLLFLHSVRLLLSVFAARRGCRQVGEEGGVVLDDLLHLRVRGWNIFRPTRRILTRSKTCGARSNKSLKAEIPAPCGNYTRRPAPPRSEE